MKQIKTMATHDLAPWGLRTPEIEIDSAAWTGLHRDNINNTPNGSKWQAILFIFLKSIQYNKGYVILIALPNKIIKWIISHPFLHRYCSVRFQFFSISNNFIVSQYTFSTIHMYTKRLHQHINNSVNLSNVMGANGAGNPVGFMGSLSDTLNIIYHNRGARVQGVQQ